jgi:hypothetical protein
MNQKILDLLEDFDVRRELGVSPGRLNPERLRMLECALNHDRIFYNMDTCTLMNFRPMEYHEIRRPVRMDIFDDLFLFNIYQGVYVYEAYGNNGSVLMDPVATAPWATEYRIKIIWS